PGAGKDSFVAVVVRDRGERGGVGGERHGGQRPAIAPHAADDLGRDVLRIGRAAAVAEEQQLVPRGDGDRDQPDGALEIGSMLGEEHPLGVQAVVEERVDQLLRAGHGPRIVGVGSRASQPAARSPKRRVAMSAMVRPMLSAEVAPGDGAFSPWTVPSASTMRKSSTSSPLGSTACARTPAPPRSRSSARRSGTSRRSAVTKADLLSERYISPMPVFQKRPT